MKIQIWIELDGENKESPFTITGPRNIPYNPVIEYSVLLNAVTFSIKNLSNMKMQNKETGKILEQDELIQILFTCLKDAFPEVDFTQFCTRNIILAR